MSMMKSLAAFPRIRSFTTTLLHTRCTSYLLRQQPAQNLPTDNHENNPVKWEQSHLTNISETLLQRYKMNNFRARRWFSSDTEMSLNEYNDIVEETLEELADYFEDLYDDGVLSGEFDCVLADGVMTVNLGHHGIYVINKQTPNRQIWLSSPICGPKRYDFVDGVWKYTHDGETLHQVLSEEFTEMYDKSIDFQHLPFGGKDS